MDSGFISVFGKSQKVHRAINGQGWGFKPCGYVVCAQVEMKFSPKFNLLTHAHNPALIMRQWVKLMFI